MQFLGFKSCVISASGRPQSLLGFATMLLPKEMCEQDWYITGPGQGAKSFDNGKWLVTVTLLRIEETGEIRMELPAGPASHNGWHSLVKVTEAVHQQMLDLIMPHVPIGEGY